MWERLEQETVGCKRPPTGSTPSRRRLHRTAELGDDQPGRGSFGRIGPITGDVFNARAPRGVTLAREQRERGAMDQTPFRDLYFGKSDPNHELRSNPDDFIKSYVDLNGAIERVVSGETNLILGPKGTGKSALGLYIEKTSANGRYFARMKNASHLPLAEIPQLKTGEPRGAVRTRNAWRFILLSNYLDVALSDADTKLPQIRDVRRVIKGLRDFGFMASDSGHSLLRAHGAAFTLPSSQMGTLFKDEGGRELGIYTLLPYLERWATSLTSPNRHILLLDGLDSIFLNDATYDESLSGLAQAAYEINLRLMQARATGSVVLLIRNDIFSRISLVLPDAHKMRDFAFDLDWRVLSGAAGASSPLIQLVNRKPGQERGGGPVDVLSYFPERIAPVGGRTNRRRRGPTRLQYLLNLTRHTPRDILQLMEHIRLASVHMDPTPVKPLPVGTIREGVVQYSTKYFVDAIHGEFAGYEGGREEAEAALNALKWMEEPRFTRSDYRRSLQNHFPGLEAKADEFLRLLFYSGALGNLFDTGSERYMVFYHRRNDVDLNVQGTLVLHNALTHAWSKKFGLS